MRTRFNPFKKNFRYLCKSGRAIKIFGGLTGAGYAANRFTAKADGHMQSITTDFEAFKGQAMEMVQNSTSKVLDFHKDPKAFVKKQEEE